MQLGLYRLGHAADPRVLLRDAPGRQGQGSAWFEHPMEGLAYQVKRRRVLNHKVGNEHIDAVKAAILTLKEELENSKVPILIEQKRKQIKELEDSISTELPAVQNSRMTWSELYQKLEQTSDLKTLYKSLNKGGKFNNNAKDYLKALFFSEFSRRIPRERSLENLGMVNLSYPGIDNISSPNIANLQ